MTVQPGATGVVLAGTGDPNDSLDSYYGAGILRSTDGGNTWSLIQQTTDVEQGLGIQDYTFLGESFAGFAWSTVTPQLVVAAVSQAYEGTLVAAERPYVSYEGLYFSTDSGASWHLATITDPSGSDVQGPLDAYDNPHGNAATAVVWNPVRQVFVAAIRYHGYYESSDGMNWTRFTTQPGTGLSTAACPTNIGSIGSTSCPIFRGALAVNPQTGDTFAWTVDAFNQDQGLWQDLCNLSSGACSNPTVNFSKQWSTAPLDANVQSKGTATILNGDYNLALAAVPSGQDTLLLAGDNDLWRCSLAAGCAWRNTTNATGCMSAQVAPYQHALAWNPANPLEVFLGNDSGLWRSMDDVGETGSTCNATDASHFQNLNPGLGSLAEAGSLSAIIDSPYTLMAGLGANGTAGVKSTTGATSDWPQILGGEGGPVAVDPTNSSNWYVNNQAGVSIYLCAQTGSCTPSDFGSSPVVNNADVAGDGQTMTRPAIFLVDPLDSTQLLIGTCRIWRGPAGGSAWSSADAISPFLDGVTGRASCNGGAPLTSISAVTSGPYQVASNCGTLLAAGSSCTLSVTFLPTAAGTQTGTLIVTDILKSQTVLLTGTGLLPPAFAVSPGSLTFATQSVGIPSTPILLTVSNSGGAPMANVGFQITGLSASSFSVGSTTCGSVLANGSSCTAQIVFTPATAGGNTATLTVTSSTLGVKPVSVSLSGTGQAIAGLNVSPAQLSFVAATLGQASAAQTLTVSNTGALAVIGLSLTTTASFSVAQTSCGTSLAAGASCTASIIFTPTANGSVTGTLTVSSSNDLPATVLLSGAGGLAGSAQITPGLLTFPVTGVGASSPAQTVTVANTSAVTLTVLALHVSGAFQLQNNTCPANLAPGASCTVGVVFAPAQAGPQTGNLTVASTALPASVPAPLSGTGFDFTATVGGQSSFTVASGQTANYALALAPQGGVPATFTFQCAGLPANAACVFNPAVEAVPANATSNVTVQITTGQAVATAHAGQRRPWSGWPIAWSILILPLARKRRRKLLLGLVLLLVAGGLSSCSGAGGAIRSDAPATLPGATPVGTYHVAVTATAAGLAHSATVTLTVD